MKQGRTTSLADPPATDSRRRVLARTRLDFWLDALLLAAYTLAYSLGFTGIATHEWLGIGLGAALLVHLTLHWDWVVRTTGKLLRPGGRERFIWLVNLLLLVSMTLCVASGILISEVALPQLGISPPPSSFWRQVHDTTATLTLILVPVHAALRCGGSPAWPAVSPPGGPGGGHGEVPQAPRRGAGRRGGHCRARPGVGPRLR